MKKQRLVALALIAVGAGFLSSSAGTAYGYCIEPRAPTLTFLTKPSKPYCATSGDGCEEWEISMYRSKVERYIDELQQYLDDVEKFRKNAYEYAECMADLS